MTQNRTDPDPRGTLAVDAGSPVVSVALANQGEVLSERSAAIRRSSQDLIQMIDLVLSEAGTSVDNLAGILALRGPGSFTGLRVGLATCLGLHQALGIPATTVTTLEVLASVAPERNLVVLSAVSSIRESWLIQTFRSDLVPEPLDEPRTVTTGELRTREVDLVIGFGLNDASLSGERPFRTPTLEPPPLASPALRLRENSRAVWDPAGLVQPLYLQAPLATKPPTVAQ